MMHLGLIIVSLAVAYGMRLFWRSDGSTLQDWQPTLLGFLVPALLPIMTEIAIVCMGPHGHMVMYWEGWLSYSLSAGVLAIALGWALKLALDGYRTLRSVRHCERSQVGNYTCRILELELPYSAQVGFWNPELVISRGLLQTLDETHLQAVLAHEAGHRYYRDTFWTFWLGWLRRLTAWLPESDRLWHDLLLLREMRADRWATQSVDPITLAESLLQVAQAPQSFSSPVVAEFSLTLMGDRITTRIQALLTPAPPQATRHPAQWLWFLVALFPLLIVPFHY
ncbi:MAG: M56 family peptidase [Leptolyngbya sp. DLM2.Bin15]|nr:MAG: M56 family peptidase [Leptolyngbya sp. DLM2.Bin15]